RPIRTSPRRSGSASRTARTRSRDARRRWGSAARSIRTPARMSKRRTRSTSCLGARTRRSSVSASTPGTSTTAAAIPLRSRVGIGIAGVGLMGRRHAENAAWHIPGARLVAVFDADRTVASRVGQELGAPACASLDELLENDEVRVVVVASPSRFHADQAVAALARGKDVLLEKPMAHSLGDCDRVIQAAERGSARLQIGFMRRYDPAYAEAKRLIVSG